MASDRNGDDKASHILHSFNTVIEHYQAEEHEALQMFRESNAAEMEKLFEKVEMLRSQRKSLEGHKQKALESVLRGRSTKQSSKTVKPVNATKTVSSKRPLPTSPPDTVTAGVRRSLAVGSPGQGKPLFRDSAVASTHPTIVPTTDHTGHMEIRCCFCGTNCRQDGRLLNGVTGLAAHIGLLHKKELRQSDMRSTTLAQEHCTYHVLSAKEIEDIVSGRPDAYKVIVHRPKVADGNARLSQVLELDSEDDDDDSVVYAEPGWTG